MRAAGRGRDVDGRGASVGMPSTEEDRRSGRTKWAVNERQIGNGVRISGSRCGLFVV